MFHSKCEWTVVLMLQFSHLGSEGDRLHMLIHCHGNNSTRYSDQCQQARSLNYANKHVTPKARHNITMMAKGRKQKLFQTTQTAMILYTRLVWGATLLSRRILRGVVSLTLRTQIGRPEGAQLFGNDYILYLQYY